jgi:hypothetical protein
LLEPFREQIHLQPGEHEISLHTVQFNHVQTE